MSPEIKHLLSKKGDRPDRTRFNLIENLIIYCIQKCRRVPAESGVQFRIGGGISESALCLLFRTDDRGRDWLLEGIENKPDYLCMYLTRDECIFTFIELKGRDSKKLAHGIDQICNLRDHLKRALEEHFPRAFNVHFQGILLCPFNSDTPARKLDTTRQSGLTILPIPANHCADLAWAVGRRLKLTDKAPTPSMAPDCDFNSLEKFLMNALDRPLPESHRLVNHPDRVPTRQGVQVDLLSPEEDGHSTLVCDNTGFSWYFSQPSSAQRVHSEGIRLKLEAAEKTSKTPAPALQFAKVPVKLIPPTETPNQVQPHGR